MEVVDSLEGELSKAQQDTVKIKILNSLAWQYFYYQPDVTEQYAQEIYGTAKKTNHISGIWDAYNIFGVLHYSKAQYDSANYWFHKALQLSSDDKYYRARIFTVRHLGTSYLALSEFGKADSCFLELLQLSKAVEDKNGMAKGHKSLGISYYTQGKYLDALMHYLKTDSILGNEINIDRGDNLQNIGMTYNVLENLKAEKKYYELALDIYQKLNDDYGIHSVKTSLGKAEMESENYESAKEHLLTALAYYEKINDPIRLGDVQQFLGYTYYYLKEYDLAKNYFQTTLQTLKNIEGTPTLNQAYRGLGDVYTALNDYDKALEAYEIGRQHAEKIGSLQSLVLILKAQGNLYFKMNSYNKAFETFDQYQVLSDSLNDIKRSKVIHEIEAKYQDEKKQQQIELLETQNQLKEKEKARQQLIFLVSIVGSLLIMSLLYFLYRTHQKANKKLKELDSLKSRFFANISHEFRTPLTLISGPIENRLHQPNIDESEKSDLEMVYRNSKQLLNLVDQLLDLSKLESGGYRLKVESGDLVNLIQAVISPFKYSAIQKKITLNIAISESHQKTWFDRDAIQKIIANLLSNAIKYTPERGNINFSSGFQNGKVVLVCENSGPGIPEKDLDKIFDRFYQQNSAVGGVGIGLALIKELTDHLGGTVSASSIPNQSTIFKVILPVDIEAFNRAEIKTEKSDIIQPAANVREYSETDIEAELSDPDHPILLIVEDNVEVRKFIKNILKHNYQIHEAENGKLGIDLATEYIPDLIISDIMMPEADGIELCRTLKTDERTSHIPIILLTARAGEENELKGLETGADDYITKPFNSEILKVRVEKLIEIRKNLQNRFSQEIILKPTDISITTADEKFLNKVRQILDQHISNSEFTAEFFSREIGMSRMQLHRKLKALTGLSTNHFIRRQRICLAADLLSKSGINMAEVGYLAGFNNPSYFSKCFKEQFGCTPSDYAERKLAG